MGTARDDRRAIHEEFLRIDRAFRAGDVAALRAALGDPSDFPNSPLPPASFGPAGTCLEYAVYYSPLACISTLLELGADPNPPSHVHAGFLPLHAALSKARGVPGSAARPDVNQILTLLLAHGADPNQRGHNDCTPLHMAVVAGSLEAARILLAGGADPTLRTRIDDELTAREEAERGGLHEIAALLAAHETKRSGSR